MSLGLNMSNPLFNTNLECCSRADGTKYVHPCGCPEATLICRSVEKTANMCGMVDSNNPTTPPTYYQLKEEVTGANQYVDGPEITTTTRTVNEDGVCTSNTETTGSTNCIGYSDGSKYYTTRSRTYTPRSSDAPCDGTVSGGPAISSQTKAPDCSAPLTWDADSVTVTVGSGCDYECFNDGQGGAFPGASYSGSGSLPWSPLSRTWSGSFTGTVVFDGSCFGGGSDSYPYEWEWSIGTEVGDYTYSNEIVHEKENGTTYSNPDTEEAALERAEEVEDEECSSVLEDRVDSVFVNRTVKYAVLLTNLVPGATYEGEVPIDSGLAEHGTSITYAPDSPDPFSFPATKPFHIEGGILNVPEQDFIDNNYSLNPLDYGLDSDEDVISPTTDLSHSQGMAYRANDPFVQKA
jgi:hypothetical protein